MYQIFTDEVLGSGQFGVVYKGEMIVTTLLNYYIHGQMFSKELAENLLWFPDVLIISTKHLLKRFNFVLIKGKTEKRFHYLSYFC